MPVEVVKAYIESQQSPSRRAGRAAGLTMTGAA